jgi:hypothetical protein
VDVTRPALCALSTSAASTTMLYRRKFKLKAKVKSGPSTFYFQALSSRRFQCRFDRVNLHRPTMRGAALGAISPCRTVTYRRKLNLKAKFEGGSSYYSFKRFVPGAINAGFDSVNPHRPTVMDSVVCSRSSTSAASRQGLTLVHF